ncbi:MAG: response regulator [Gemmataceae bacterium]
MNIRKGSKPLRLLIVDDCEDTASSLASLARLWGHHAWVAHEGETAVQLAARQRPDALILDLGLPDMSGWDLARRLRAMPGMDGLFVVVVTGQDEPADLFDAHRDQCSCCLLKPADPVRLRHLLEAGCYERQGHDC